MKKHKIDGHIIHMNSVAGHRPIGYVGENVYPASKYAVTALTESMRFELLKAGTKIKVTVSLKLFILFRPSEIYDKYSS